MSKKTGKWQRQPLHERFMNRIIPVPFSGCWIWLGGLSTRGYGLVSTYGEQRETAHRLAYKLFRDPSITSEQVICHICDVRCCCNPDHLFLGTQSDNMADMLRKGRHVRRSAVSTAVLASIKADAITPARVLAERHGVAVRTIRNYRNGKTWSNV